MVVGPVNSMRPTRTQLTLFSKKKKKKKKKKRENANANTFISIQTLPYKIILVSTHFDVELKVHI